MNALIRATLLKRYKRFLAEIALPSGEICTAHCPNPGAMTGLAAPGTTIHLAPVTNPKAKLPYRWVLSEVSGGLVGIDTSRANPITAAALNTQRIPDFAEFTHIRPEVPIGSGTRLDFHLTQPKTTAECYLEVKSVTLSPRPALAAFPDTPTLRGQKHLECLMTLAKQGHRAALLFVVQRTDCTAFALAETIDPRYASLCREAVRIGVGVYAWDCTIDATSNRLELRRPLELARTLQVS